MILRDKRIFIIEDNLDNRTIMQVILSKEGAKLAFERWGVDVVERLARFMPVDAILLDLMFPNNVTGYDVFEEIRRHDKFKHVPIVAVTAADASTALPKAQEMGFAGYISKPVNFLSFGKQVLAVLNGEEIWDAADSV